MTRAKLSLARRADHAGNRSGIARADGGVRQIELSSAVSL
jgi:hypothetical protein